MKHFVVRLALAIFLFGNAINSHAQAVYADVTGGALTINIAAPLAAILSAQNIAAAAYTEAPYDNQIPYLGIISGAFELNSGRGSFAVQGDFVLTNGTSTIKVISLNVETSNAAKPQVTGAVYLNGNYIAHIAILQMTQSNPFGAPIAAGPLVPAVLSPALSALVANVFGVTVPAGTPGATISINTTFMTI
jgi:hypothetical protein